MKTLLSTWAKTRHTRPDPATPVPLGERVLMWARTADGQADPNVVAARGREFGMPTAKVRVRRLDAIVYGVPNVPLPRVGGQGRREWAAGEDKPTPRKR